MLIVLSDLHFADSSENCLNGYNYNHNLPAEVYKSFFKEIGEFIRDSEIKTIDLVLAGDIFEITRSAWWHQDHLKPYLHNDEIKDGSEAEKRILQVINSIVREDRVDATLKIFRRLSEYYQKPVNIHFIPGNHDRLANSSHAIRMKVRELLGLEAETDFFANQYIHHDNENPLVLVRHGHEYDKSNFSVDVNSWLEIPTVIEKKYYDAPVLGDIVTTEVASKLPLLFREHYTDKKILSNQDLMVMYQRLMDFDNVRPSNALINFLFSTPGLSKKEVWNFIEPVMLKMLDNISLNKDIRTNLVSYGNMRRASAITLRSVLRSRLWRKGLPFWLMKTLINPISSRSKILSNLNLMLRESCIKDDASTINCVVSGHTHVPTAGLLKVKNGIEKYYINSGTFRNLITATPSLSRFGRLRSKARVLIFTKEEHNPDYARETGWSFDFNARYAYGSVIDETIL